MTSLTVIVPTVLIVVAVDERLKRESRSIQLKSGVGLLALLFVPLAGLFSAVPGGSFAGVPDALRQAVDYVFALAIAPLLGAFVIAMSLVWRGLRRSGQSLPD